jgi:hypothetical protein
MQLFGYGLVKIPIPYILPPGAHKNPTIRTNRGYPKVHPPKRKEKTKILAPGHQILKIKLINKNTDTK